MYSQSAFIYLDITEGEFIFKNNDCNINLHFVDIIHNNIIKIYISLTILYIVIDFVMSCQVDAVLNLQ